MEIIVGRKGQQRAAITDLSVSREHCKLTSNADGTYLLENLSANGTYVDGRSVVRSVVTADTVIQLGATFKIIVKDLLPVAQQKPNPAVSQTPPVDPRQKEYELKFRQLKNVYDKYTADKIALQKEAGKNNFFRMLPMTLLSLVGLGAVAIPGLGEIAPVISVLGLGLLVYSLVKSYSVSTENPEKMEALNKQFMIDYVCPKCGNFLGYVPFETLANKKSCSFCKCKWS
jgi:hypothetical protein